MSGADSSSRHSATRRFSPPDSVAIFASHGGRRSASAAISSLRSSSQPPAASMASCNCAWRVEQRIHLLIVHRLGELLADLIELLQLAERIADAGHDGGAHVLGGVELRLLGQEADADAALRPRFSVEGRIESGHDLQQ